MAKGDLHVAYISRASCEAALGCQLSEMRLAHTEQEGLQKERAESRGTSTNEM